MKHILRYFIFGLLFLTLSCRHDVLVPDIQNNLADCDSINVTYTNFVQPYMNKKSCVLCHTDDMGFYPYLDTYDSIQSYAVDSARAVVFMEKILTNHKIINSEDFNTPCEVSSMRNWIKTLAYD